MEVDPPKYRWKKEENAMKSPLVNLILIMTYHKNQQCRTYADVLFVHPQENIVTDAGNMSHRVHSSSHVGTKC